MHLLLNCRCGEALAADTGGILLIDPRKQIILYVSNFNKAVET